MTAIYVILGWIAVSVIGAAIWTAIVRGHKRGPKPVVVWDERTYGVVGAAVEDPTPDDLTAVADAVAECGHQAMGSTGRYVCRLDPTHNWWHADGVMRWDDGEAMFADTWQPARPGDTPGALVPGEGDTAPQPTLRKESIRCQSRYHYGLTDHYLCDLDLGHVLPHADSRGQARVRWYGTDERVTL